MKTTQQCDFCEKEKSLDEFKIRYRNSKEQSISKTCLECMQQPRICDVCGREKALSAFGKERRNKKLYVRSVCGSCKTTARKWKHKQKLMEAIGQTACQRCGISDIRVLSFHHRDDEEKDFGLAQKLGYSFGSLVAEAHKCDILCMNCHAIVHSPFAP